MGKIQIQFKGKTGEIVRIYKVISLKPTVRRLLLTDTCPFFVLQRYRSLSTEEIYRLPEGA